MNKVTKIILSLTLIFTLAFSLVACSAKNENKNGASTEAQSAEAASTSEAEAGNDGRNYVMNFVGNYDNGGCYIFVEAEGADGAKFTVTWPLTDFESETYTFSGTFEPDTLTVHYSNSTKIVNKLDAEGNVTGEKTEYTDGSGKIIFHEDGTLEWQDENEAERLVDNATFTYFNPNE